MITNRNKFIYLGVLIAFSLWFLEVFLHVLVFKSGDFRQELLSLQDYNELWMRLVIATAVITSGIIAQRMANKITEEYENERRIKEALEVSLKEIKLLQGILPICAWCKRIRDDKGYWSQVEAYITEHSDARFSHSICPDCANKMYSEITGKHKIDGGGSQTPSEAS